MARSRLAVRHYTTVLSVEKPKGGEGARALPGDLVTEK